MIEAAIPADESERLATLLALNLLDTPREERFDRIARTAGRLFGVPIALVSLIDANRQWFKACIGLDVQEADRATSFCAHAVAEGDMLVIEDALADPRFAGNPYVTGPTHVRFYAGQPLAAPDGHLLGTLCVIGHSPRTFGAEERQALRDLAAWAELEISKEELGQALAARRETEERARVIMAHVPDGIFLFDEKGRVAVANPAAADICQLSQEQVVGRSVDELIDDPRWLDVATSVREADPVPAAGDVRELSGRRADGTFVPIEVSVAPVHMTGRPFYIAVVRDVSERQRYERLRRRTDLILESAGEGILGLDVDGRVAFANRAALELLGHVDETLIGHRAHDLIHHSKADGTPYPRSECPTRESLTSGAVVRVDDEVFWRADGTSVPVEYVSSPVHESDGSIAGVVEVFTDISERLRLEQMQRRFVSTVSHELRTPLTSIKGYLEILVEGEAGELTLEQSQYARIAYRNAKRLQELIGELLLISRLESGHLKLWRERVRLRDVLSELVEEMRPGAEAKGVNVEFDAEPQLNVTADRGRLKQACANLLSNAIKFSPEDATVWTSARRDGAEAVVEVSDEGPGIPPDELPNIGQRFFRASTAGTVEGTGLGLAITSEIIQQHGGRLECESQEGHGSSFWLRFPVEAS